MSLQPTGYNLPSFANITVHNDFTLANQLNGASQASLQNWIAIAELNASLDEPDRTSANDCYEAITGRVHELMHYRSHQAEF